jgi:hypothetical protein
MTGNDRVRFCSHCAKDVNNISEMTPKEAIRLARGSGGNICIRYKFDPVTKAPIFAGGLHQITRRAPVLASGAMVASLSLSTLALAQESAPLIDPAPTVARTETPINDREKERTGKASGTGMGSIYGTVIDPAGAVIPGASVRLRDKEGNEIRSITTDDAGNYQIDALEPKDYNIDISAPGFQEFEREVRITDGGRRKLNADLYIGSMGGVMVSVREYDTPLATAVSQEDIDAVRDLISKGENVNEREDDKATPLFVAVNNGYTPIAEVLLNFGAKVNARNKEKQTALMQMDEDASVEMVDLLVRYGAKVNLVDNVGNTALIIAAESASVEVVKALIDAGADVNVVNKEGRSALMAAADDIDIDKVRALLLAGAKPELRDKEGRTAWDMTSDTEIQDLLVTYGAEPGTRDGEVPPADATLPQETPVD